MILKLGTLLVVIVNLVICMISKDAEVEKIELEVPKQLYDSNYINSIFKAEEQAFYLSKAQLKTNYLDSSNYGHSKCYLKFLKI